MATNAGLGILLQPRKKHPCDGLALLDGAVIRVLPPDVGHMEACTVVSLHPVGHFVVGGQGHDVPVGFNDFVIPHRLPAQPLLPMFADAGDGGVLRGSRAMDNEVGNVSHSSGFKRG